MKDRLVGHIIDSMMDAESGNQSGSKNDMAVIVDKK